LHSTHQTKDGFYDVTKEIGISEPALLFTCKAIRKEAVEIFFRKNRFRLLMLSWDPATEVLIMRKEKILGTGEIAERRRALGHGDGRQWENLLEWLRRYHTEEAHPLAVPAVKAYEDEDMGADQPDEYGVVDSMFKLVNALSGSSWEDITPMMIGLRHGLNAIDHSWRKD
jgi:hypothetical protein